MRAALLLVVALAAFVNAGERKEREQSAGRTEENNFDDILASV